MWFRSGKVTGMVIEDANPQNHNYISYEYAVGSKTYSGTGYGPHHEEMHKGELVEVSYFPPMPSQAVITSKDEQRRDATMGIVSSLIMGIFGGLVDYWNRRRKSRRQVGSHS